MEKKEIISRLAAMERWESEGIAPADDTVAYVMEIVDRWAPTAERLGLASEQSRLQELAVKLGFPDDYARLQRLVAETEITCEMAFRTFVLPIGAMLDDMGIHHTIRYRMKSIFSIWRKMRTEGKRFDDVYDLFAARIVYKPEDSNPGSEYTDRACQGVAGNPEHLTCWRIYTAISMLYRIHPDRVKNWVGHPKPSGYEALHMTVMGPEGKWYEVQIRSERMDYEAEHGSAAHWRYKMETASCSPWV